jgi:hypothetical protein
MTLNRIYEALYKQNKFFILFIIQIIFQNFIGPILNILLILSPWIKNNILDSIYIHQQNNELINPNEFLNYKQSSINNRNLKKRNSVPIKRKSDISIYKKKIKSELLIDFDIDNQDSF